MRALILAVLLGCSGSTQEPAVEVDSDTPLNDTGAVVTDASVDTAMVPDTFVATETTSETPSETAPPCGCSEYTDPVNGGAIAAPLNETSGLAVSRKNAGVIYAHNDSGDTARIFAVDPKGAMLGEIAFGGATAVDWEDIALGPCATGTCVWIGDHGDNAAARTNYALYSIPEPDLDGKPFAKKTIAPNKFPFAYPDGKWNCEALLVHPTTGEIFVVTKASTIDAGVYRFPSKLEPGVAVTLEKVGSASGTKGSLVTGGDISPCGDRILLRTYEALLEYSGATVAAAFGVAPKKVPVAKEGQGEAVAYRADGRGYFTVSEGAGAPLYANACR